MVKVKPIDVVVRKWKERAEVATEDYRLGVQNAEDWASATLKAANAWEQGIRQAITEKRFEGGVKAAGTEKWRKGAIEKGATRFADGISKSVDEYQAKMSEVLRVIEQVKLPERGPRGDPKNIQRVAAIADALHKYAIARKKG